MAAMLVALRESRDVLPSLSHEIWFAGLMGEEAGQQGAKTLSAREKFDFAIVGEPTRLQIVNAHKGVLWLTLRAHGRAAHAPRRRLAKMRSRKWSRPSRFCAANFAPISPLGSTRYLERRHSTSALIHGGTKINIVPDVCEASDRHPNNP